MRFNAADTQRLVPLHGRDWPADALQQATDGWAAAMILLLATRSEPRLDAALRGGTARLRLFAFFAGEVLAALPPPHSAALLRGPAAHRIFAQCQRGHGGGAQR